MTNVLQKNTLNVRMYRVGFGDCFLLSFPVGEEHRHVLVDCGAHPKGTRGNLREVAENVRELTGNRLAAVVATHRHQDHIWGFERGRETFRGMTVDEVWLPWVEELGNPEARAMWKEHAEVRAMLEAKLAMAPAGPRHDAVEAVLLNLKPNEVALDELRTGFGKGADGVRYLYAGHADLIAPNGIDGLVVKILGPPKDENFLKKMNPPKAERWELAARGGLLADGDLFASPFDKRWEDPDQGAYWATEETKSFDRAEQELFTSRMSDAMDLAFALEDAVNNSSLALLFLFGKQGLLMPGDAQWGNWKYWIEQQVAEEMFDQVTVYKVGHHGSHNATPKSVIDRLPKDVTVLVPTQDKPFPTIPEPKLITALEARSSGRLVRSDSEGTLPAGFRQGEFWIDYYVETK
jgi:beta-lactamase superfamily II metal-dependent hydrolase